MPLKLKTINDTPYVFPENSLKLSNCRELIFPKVEMKSINVFINTLSKGLLIFAADSRAIMHSDWYNISG